MIMKTLVLFLQMSLVSLWLMAQTPNAFNYQAVVRNTSGDLMTNATIGVQVSLLEGSANGTVVYTETFNTVTSQFGGIDLQIGTGTVTSGQFSNIDWGNATGIWMRVSIDPTGGASYTQISNTQLLSVPYALYAARAADLEGKKVAFSASGSGASQYFSGSDNYFVYSGEEYDLGGDFDLASSSFTAPVDGIYHFDAVSDLAFSSNTNAQMVLFCIYKNGNIVKFSKFIGSASDNLSAIISASLSLSAGDIIKIGFRPIYSYPTISFDGAGSDGSYFSGYKLY